MSKFHSSSRRKLNVCSSGRHSPPLAPSHHCGLAYRPWLLSSTQFGGKDKLCLSHLCLGSFRCSGGDKLYALLRGSLIVFTRLGHFAVLPQNSAESLGFSAFQPWLLVRITWGGGLLKKHQCPTLVPVKSECVGCSGSTSVISQPPGILMWEPLLQGSLRAHLLFHFHGQKCQSFQAALGLEKCPFPEMEPFNVPIF